MGRGKWWESGEERRREGEGEREGKGEEMAGQWQEKEGAKGTKQR